FDVKEMVDMDVENNKEFFLNDERYDSEAPEIPFLHKDSIINFD
ncbi:24369_t:CDS:1, partial [Gigaspora margarita]